MVGIHLQLLKRSNSPWFDIFVVSSLGGSWEYITFVRAFRQERQKAETSLPARVFFRVTHGLGGAVTGSLTPPAAYGPLSRERTWGKCDTHYWLYSVDPHCSWPLVEAQRMRLLIE